MQAPSVSSLLPHIVARDKLRAMNKTLAAMICAGLSATALAQKPPQEALHALRPAEGLRVTLFAAEPDVVNPTCMDVDARGRVWVCEAVNYRAWAHPPQGPVRSAGDRIVVLEDNDGDGRADKRTVFYEGEDLQAPLGIAVIGNKVWISQSPDIFTIEINPDGSAGRKEVFLTGFGGKNNDHGVHSVYLGPDGKLYGCFGNSGANVQFPDGRRIVTDGKALWGGVAFRCNLDGSGVEVLGHNFRNNYEIATDSFGTTFVTDNDDDGNQSVRFAYVMEGGNFGYLGNLEGVNRGHSWGKDRKPHQSIQRAHWHQDDPGVVPNLMITGAGSPAGLAIYEGALLPEKYRGMPIHADAGPREVRCYRLRADGAGYRTEGIPQPKGARVTIEELNAISKPDLLLREEGDTWFRPVDVTVAPDGSIFVADWYDPGVGGHHMGDWTRGRVYRLLPSNHDSRYVVPPVNVQTANGLAAALASPNLAVRALAILKIQELGTKAIPILHPLNRHTEPTVRARALWMLGTFGSSGKKFLRAALRDPDPRFRMLAVRSLQQNNVDWLAFRETAALLRDPDAAVRRELLLALREVPLSRKGAANALVVLADQFDGQDRFYLAAVGIAFRGREAELFPALAANWQNQWNKKITWLLWELRAPTSLAFLQSSIANETIPLDWRADALGIAADLPSQEAGQALLRFLQGNRPNTLAQRALDALAEHVEGKWKPLRDSPELAAAVEQALATPSTRTHGVGLIARGKLRAFLPQLLALARNQGAGATARAAAVEALGNFRDAQHITTLEPLLGDAEGIVRVAALNALAQIGGDAAEQKMKSLLAEGAMTLDVQQEVARALGRTRAGGLLLLEMARANELPLALRGDVADIAHGSGFESVRIAAEQVFPRRKKLDLNKLLPREELLARTGDVAHGRKVFFDEQTANCARCHVVSGKGREIGPDLSVIGQKFGKDGMLDAILNPSAAIAPEYVVWILRTRSEGTADGFMVEESPDFVVLKDANGQMTRFATGDILERRRSELSMMPEGLAANMSEQDLVDLLEFLASLKPITAAEGTGKVQARAWWVCGPFPNTDDRGLFLPYPPEQSAVDLSASYTGRDGPVGWRRIHTDEAGYLDIRKAHARPDQSVTYFFAIVHSAEEQAAALLIGSDDGVKVWLNGVVVHENHTHRAASPEEEAVRVRLQKGPNTLLVKVDQGDGAAGLFFTILADKEIRIAAEKP